MSETKGGGESNLSYAEQLDGCFSTVQATLLNVNRLEGQFVSLLIEVDQRRTRPLLILLGIVLPEPIDILSQLL